jgi:hypothetical protein
MNQAGATRFDWYAVAWLSLSSAVAVAAMAAAYVASRESAAWAEPLFWMAIIGLAVPIGIRLLMTSPSRAERIVLLLLLAVGLYLAKVLQSPTSFTLYDELQHVRPALDLLDSGRLFSGNPLLPVYTYFPGLEIATVGVAASSGNDLFLSGVLVIGAARILLVLALFTVYELAGADARIASIAVAIYAANPNFVFFGGQYSYESLALPLAIGAVALVAWRESHAGRRAWITVGSMLVIAAVVVTHHISSYTLIAFLGLWAIAERIAPPPILVVRGSDAPPHDQSGRRGIRVTLPIGVGGLALFTAVLAVGWMVYVAQIAVRYLAPAVANLGEFVRLMLGLSSTRALFVTASGPAPLWEPIVSFAAVLLILAALPFGWWIVWGRPQGRALRLVLAAIAVAYPASLALRLAPRGAELSSRTTDFVFVGVAFIVGLAISRIDFSVTFAQGQRAIRPAAAAAAAAAAAISVLFVGGLTIGSPAWARLPGPYLVSADARSIETEGIDAARWMLRELGPDNRIATDRINRLLMGVYGHQTPITEFAHGVQTALLFESPTWTASDVDLVRTGGIRYVVVDGRLSHGLPETGHYFETGEPLDLVRTEPLDAAALTKFSAIPGVDLIFDSGNIKIYDLGGLSSAS